MNYNLAAAIIIFFLVLFLAIKILCSARQADEYYSPTTPPATPEKKDVGPVDQKRDNVNHPSHYTAGGIECIDALEAATTGLEGLEAVCTANIIKYLWRWKWKNGVEDLRKARWYLDKLILILEK